MPHTDANQEPVVRPAVEPAVEPAIEPAVEPEPRPAAQPPATPAPRSPRGMAKVLERAIAPDLVPAEVKRGGSQIDTVTYIAEFADIARHQGPWAAGGAAYPWISPQET